MPPFDWTRGKIRYELERVGFVEMRQVDKAFGLSLGTVSNTIRHPYEVGEYAIAKALGLHPSTIWPSRYDTAGQRHSPQPMSAYKRPGAVGHGQNAKAA